MAGVEAFEGWYPVGRTEADLSPVDTLLNRLVELLRLLDSMGAFDSRPEIIFTGGGSWYPDRVALAAAGIGGLSKPIRTVVRSGGTVVHEHGPNAGNAPLSAEMGNPVGALRPALELWATVVSTPEPGLALAAFGRRDVSFDGGMPVVLGFSMPGEPESAPGGVVVDRLNDQHAFVHHQDQLRVGNRLRLGIIHSCTSFDKWPLIPMLDDDDRVIAAVTTWF